MITLIFKIKLIGVEIRNFIICIFKIHNNFFTKNVRDWVGGGGVISSSSSNFIEDREGGGGLALLVGLSCRGSTYIPNE